MPARSFLVFLLLAVLSCAFASNGAAQDYALPLVSAFKNFEGPVIWGSFGWATEPPNGTSYNPHYWRGGMGLRYRPQIERDTLVATPTAVETTWAEGGKMTWKRTSTIAKDRKPGRTTLSVGYMSDRGIRLVTPEIDTRLPLRGPYVGAFYLLGDWDGEREKRKAVGKSKKGNPLGPFLGVTVAFLDVRETTAGVPGGLVKVKSSQAVSPEVYLGVNRKLNQGTYWFIEGSWQFIRLQSVSYENASSTPSPLIDVLPRDMSLHLFNVTLGVTFSAKGII